MEISLPREAAAVINILQNEGFEAYIVGGSLRNILMEKEPVDWDMTTSALPSETAEIFRKNGFKVIETGIKHGTVTVLSGDLPLEITTFRLDGEYKDSRHPESVMFTPSLKEDLARRDFTVNAMAYSEKNGITDLFGGKEDLENGILRAVGMPEKRFTEDALRILRALRFVSEHGFKIEENTRDAMKKCGRGLENISRERVCSELRRIIMGEYSEEALRAAMFLELTSYVFGNIDCSALKICGVSELERKLSLRFAYLLSALSAEKAAEITASLKMSNKERFDIGRTLEAVAFLKENSCFDVIDARIFTVRFSDYFEDALNIFAVLVENAVEEENEMPCADLKQIKQLVNRARDEDFPRSHAELEISGGDIALLGAKGKAIGDILERLFFEAVCGDVKNEREALMNRAKKYIMEF